VDYRDFIAFVFVGGQVGRFDKIRQMSVFLPQSHEGTKNISKK
jgi:hypothetical protein